jgi:SAM-dependent methyltransferase
MDIRAYNRMAWDRHVDRGNPWTLPVSSEAIAAARQGHWDIILTPTRPIPKDWFPDLRGADVLCLAGGGGQQAPILSAAGATVTVFDNSPKQLAQDRMVADRDGLALRTVEGDMRDLSQFADASFDLIVHPCSNMYVPEVQPVWAEAFRVLRPGGALLAGFMNPALYTFDQQLAESGVLQVKYALPYSDLTSLMDEERQQYIAEGDALEFGHTLEAQIGGQLAAGFLLVGFYEDRRPGAPPARYMPTHMATRAIKR